MVLTQEEIDGCREAFLAFDKDRSGTIDVSKGILKLALTASCWVVLGVLISPSVYLVHQCSYVSL